MANLNFPMYFDKVGATVDTRSDAEYMISSSVEENEYLLLRRSIRGRWKKLAQGDLITIDRAYQKFVAPDSVGLPVSSAPAAVPVSTEIKEARPAEVATAELEKVENTVKVEILEESPEAARGRQNTTPAAKKSNVTAAVWQRVKDTTIMTEEELNNYLWLCLERNRKSDKRKIIHTRLLDSMGQPVYITAHDAEDSHSSLEHSRVVDTLAMAKAFEPDCNETSMPGPIQWSYRVADYVWDANLPIMPMTPSTYTHMTVDRKSRLPGKLAEIEDAELLQAIKYSLSQGVGMASLDCSYALPIYSRQFNAVNMALPLWVPSYSMKEPVAAIMLSRTSLGYTPVTIISLRMAKIGTYPFRNPDNTWLKECDIL